MPACLQSPQNNLLSSGQHSQRGRLRAGLCGAAATPQPPSKRDSTGRVQQATPAGDLPSPHSHHPPQHSILPGEKECGVTQALRPASPQSRERESPGRYSNSSLQSTSSCLKGLNARQNGGAGSQRHRPPPCTTAVPLGARGKPSQDLNPPGGTGPSA